MGGSKEPAITRRSVGGDRLKMMISLVDGSCPVCGSTEYVRFGRTSRGTQRFRCSGCGRTFVGNGVMAGTKLPAYKWAIFVECHARGATLRETAEECEVSINTATRMRHRMNEMMERLGEA